MYVLGVDGGTSKTLAFIAQTDGTIVGMGRRGGSNIYTAETHTALANAVDASLDALVSAGIAPRDVIVGAFSMSGADWPEDFAFIQSTMEDQGLGQHIMVINDAVGGLRAGSRDGVGVAVICGTGVATVARNAEGLTWHTSFWQGAAGAVDLAQKTLRAVYRADLAIDPPTALTPAVLDFFCAKHVEEILRRGTARDTTGLGDFSGLARVLLTVADDGDDTARRIVEAHGYELGEYALAAGKKVNMEGQPFPLVLAGGVFRHPTPLLVDALAAKVRTAFPDITIVHSQFEPVIGALLLAYENIGVRVDDALLAQIKATLMTEHEFDVATAYHNIVQSTVE